MAVLVAVLLCLQTVAAGSGEAGTEIERLIAHLGSSGCEFNRNGRWYTAERAVEHLNRKYAYLRKRGLVGSAEEFIDRAAAKSSVSGEPYLVKCGAAPATRSATWLREELERLRARQD